MVIGTRSTRSSSLARILMDTSRMLREFLLQTFGAMHPFQGCLDARPPIMLDRPSCPPNKEIFEYI
jgi:hypothetical protein